MVLPISKSLCSKQKSKAANAMTIPKKSMKILTIFPTTRKMNFFQNLWLFGCEKMGAKRTTICLNLGMRQMRYKVKKKKTREWPII